MPWYDAVLLPFFTRVPYTHSPVWLRRLRRAYLQSYVSREIVAPLFAADAANVGAVDAWWPPTTAAEVILAWFDAELAATPHIGPLDSFTITLVQATAIEVAIATNIGPALPQDHLLAEWSGDRWEWWASGRGYLAAAIPTTHTGLYTIMWGMGHAFVAAHQPHNTDYSGAA